MLGFLEAFVGWIVFLYTLYIFSRDDFVLLRKNVGASELFDIAFLGLIVGLLASRIFYVAFHFHLSYLHPLVFLLIPYFPGLSLSGGIIGGVIFLIFYSKRQKLPTQRILDVIVLSGLLGVGMGVFINGLIALATKSLTGFISMGAFIFILIGFWMLVSIFQKGIWRDGRIGMLGLSYASLIAFIVRLIFSFRITHIGIDAELVSFLVASIIFLFLSFWKNNLLK